MAKRNEETRYKYPPCPECKAVGSKGLTITKLESKLRCRSCNAMFKFKFDKNCNIKIIKEKGI